MNSPSRTRLRPDGCDCLTPLVCSRPCALDQAKPWHIKSRAVSEIVHAVDQFEAWDTLSDRDIHDFGLIVTAETGESDDPIAIHTAALMFSWGRDDEAVQFIDLGVANDLPDTTDGDRASAASIVDRRAARA